MDAIEEQSATPQPEMKPSENLRTAGDAPMSNPETSPPTAASQRLKRATSPDSPPATYQMQSWQCYQAE